MEKIRHVEGLIKSIKRNLVKKEDGSYGFKYDHESMTTHTEGFGKELDFNPIEEICRQFEDEIVSIIPNAVIIITDTFSCKVIISDTNKVMRKYNLMKQQIDFYDAIRTLFFPTLKEYLVKIGSSKPEWLYFPSNIEVKTEPSKKDEKNLIIKIKKGNSIIQRGIDGTAIDFLKEDIKHYLDKFKFRNPFPKETVLLPREDITEEQLQSKPRSRKGFYVSEFYSSSQTESQNKDGKRNDLYGHINALENGEGGYIFIGIDESKKGLERIVGLEPYLRDSGKTLDKVKVEIIDKCFKYLHKFEYRIEANQYKGKSLIRIKVNSNQGKISTFYPENGDPCAFIRLNGKKKIMSPEEITKRAVIYQKL